MAQHDLVGLQTAEPSDSLTRVVLGIAGQLANVTTHLTVVFDRLPFRERASRDAVAASLVTVNALQSEIWQYLRDAPSRGMTHPAAPTDRKEQ